MISIYFSDLYVLMSEASRNYRPIGTTPGHPTAYLVDSVRNVQDRTFPVRGHFHEIRVQVILDPDSRCPRVGTWLYRVGSNTSMMGMDDVPGASERLTEARETLARLISERLTDGGFRIVRAMIPVPTDGGLSGELPKGIDAPNLHPEGRQAAGGCGPR